MAQYFASQVLSVANGQCGYQETGNNHTKYAADLGFGQNQAWCQTFVCWCFVQAYGREAGQSLLCGYMGASTMECKNAFASKNQIVQVPQPGDIWWRKRSGGGHVGIVTSASLSGNSIIIRTVEGNTSCSTAGSQWNGDGVFQKSHTITNGRDENGNQSWFGRPAYSGQGSSNPYPGGAVYENSGEGFSLEGLVNNALGGASSLIDIGAEAVGVVAGRLKSLVDDLASAFALRLSGDYLTASYEIAYQTVVTDIERDEIRSVTDYSVEKEGTNLLSYPSLVESPYIILQVGEYKFGTYSKESLNKSLNINYPNFITRLDIHKISGQVNQYTIALEYQIQYGDDPNLIDRIFSSVGYGLVKISYGDWASPTFIYKEEEAMITSLSSSVNFASSKISYTLKCTSNALVLASGYFDFPYYSSMKPSKLIEDILFDNQYGLQEVFTGMTSKTKVRNLGLIASDDKSVTIEAKHGIDALSYINYLVTCMSSSTNNDEGPIKDSVYKIAIYDDTYGDLDLNGSYFKITKVSYSDSVLSTADTYSVDVGFPTNNLVMNFSVQNDNSWALLYNYSDKVNTSEYAYSIDNSGNLVTQYSPAVAMSTTNFKMTESQKTWWTNMTQFPIKAQLEIKGLVRPTMLMTYLRVNALFYGQRHITSGLYTITRQDDTIDRNGYRTRLSLLRVAGDNDYIVRVKKQVTSNLPVAITSKNVEPPEQSTSTISAIATRAMTTVNNVWDIITNPEDFANEMIEKYGGGAIDNSILRNSGMGIGGGMYFGSGSSFSGSGGQLVWDVLMSVINNPIGVAAAMGNLACEGGYDSGTKREYPHSDWTAYKNWYSTYTDASYTQAIDSGKLSREQFRYPLLEYDGSKKSYGYGMVQWTDNRKYNLYDFAKSMGTSIGDVEMQAKFILQELSSSYRSTLNAMQNATDIDSATQFWFNKYEGINDSSGSKRKEAARTAYNLYSGRSYGI